MRRGTVYLLMALHVVFSATNYVLAKSAATLFLPVEALTMARAALAALLLVALTGTLIPRPRFSPREWFHIVFLGLLLVPLNQYLFLRGLKDTAPGHAALLYAMTPLGVLLLQAAIARRFPAAVKCAGILIAFAGVLVVMRPWTTRTPTSARSAWATRGSPSAPSCGSSTPSPRRRCCVRTIRGR